MLNKIRIYLEMIKFSHTVFALPFALMSACLASYRNGGWRLLDLVGLVACMVFARSAAMGFNRWADRDVDAKNPRTRTRAIPAGLLSSKQVLLSVGFCSVGFVASTAIFWISSENLLPLLLSAPVLLFLMAYSYTKRFTAFSHAWLGASLGFAPVAAWIALRGNVETTPVTLGAAILFWVTGFDILYACQDIDVDRKLGLNSIPAKMGYEKSMLAARFSHAAMVVLLGVFCMVTPELGAFFWIGAGLVGLLLVAEHWLVRNRNLLQINLAFFHINAVISVGLFAISLIDLYLLR